MTSTAKAKAVGAAVPHITHLSGFEKDHDAVDTLLSAMQREAKTPPPTVLGKVPAEHYQARLDELFGLVAAGSGTSAPPSPSTASRGSIEVAVAETTRPGRVIYAANYSVTFGDLLGDDEPLLRADGVDAYGTEGFLHACDAAPGWDQKHRAAVVHVITPAPEFTDKGKKGMTVPDAVLQMCADTLAAAGRVLRKAKEKRESDARAAEKQQEQARRKAERRAAAEARHEEYKPVTIRDAVFEVMPEAIAQRTFTDQRTGEPMLQARSLYYGVRKLVEQRYGLESPSRTSGS